MSAGNPCAPRSWDHPRACGEHAFDSIGGVIDKGSSPRLRGTFRLGDGLGAQVGIIPALAGNMTPSSSCMSVSWDHPRACGEHIACRMAVLAIGGSSPRLRGTYTAFRGETTDRGIIPALAGNIRWRRSRRSRRRVGSSPRLRGTCDRMTASALSMGIIPALAGNISSTRSCPDWCGDHPRACGEHIFRFRHHCRTQGSSPRLRGT